jgi:hypothetical protein
MRNSIEIEQGCFQIVTGCFVADAEEHAPL